MPVGGAAVRAGPSVAPPYRHGVPHAGAVCEESHETLSTQISPRPSQPFVGQLGLHVGPPMMFMHTGSPLSIWVMHWQVNASSQNVCDSPRVEFAAVQV